MASTEPGKAFHLPSGFKTNLEVPQATGIAGTIEETAGALENGAEFDATLSVDYPDPSDIVVKLTLGADVPNFGSKGEEKDVTAHVGTVLESFLRLFVPAGQVVAIKGKLVA